jgi:putative membrane protein
MLMMLWGAAVQWGPGEPPWGWHMWWGAWGIGMLIFMILFWALIVAGIIALIRWAFGWSGAGGRAVGGSRAIDILKERYAKGELTRDQFEAMRRDLEA